MPARSSATVVFGGSAFVAGAVLARRGEVSRLETRCFRAINRAPRAGYLAVWPLMQLGSFGGLLGVAGAAASSGRRQLATDLAVRGTGTWLVARAVKHLVGRGRPNHHIEAARLLGREQRGLGYPSGHAAVAATLYVVAAPHLRSRWRAGLAALTFGVGLARIYVGAHLPLDVLGGVALGAALGAAGPRPGATGGQGSSSTSSWSRSAWRSSRRG
jgi:glycosyltransferase 2 family protein